MPEPLFPHPLNCVPVPQAAGGSKPAGGALEKYSGVKVKVSWALFSAWVSATPVGSWLAQSVAHAARASRRCPCQKAALAPACPPYSAWSPPPPPSPQVSFGGNETMSMKQLSGGQKTLVALALIFAIQVAGCHCCHCFRWFSDTSLHAEPSRRPTTACSLLRLN